MGFNSGFKGLMRKPHTVFLSAQPLKYVCLAYIAGLNLFHRSFILLDDDWEITRTGIAGLNFLNSNFSARIK